MNNISGRSFERMAQRRATGWHSPITPLKINFTVARVVVVVVVVVVVIAVCSSRSSTSCWTTARTGRSSRTAKRARARRIRWVSSRFGRGAIAIRESGVRDRPEMTRSQSSHNRKTFASRRARASRKESRLGFTAGSSALGTAAHATAGVLARARREPARGHRAARARRDLCGQGAPRGGARPRVVRRARELPPDILRDDPGPPRSRRRRG